MGRCEPGRVRLHLDTVDFGRMQRLVVETPEGRGMVLVSEQMPARIAAGALRALAGQLDVLAAARNPTEAADGPL